MLYQWIKDEAQAKLVNGYRIVISDPKREAHFLLNQLGKDFTLISADGDWEEFTARYTAEKEYPYAQVVFYTHTGADDLSYLQEYATVGGLIDLENLAAYIRRKIFAMASINASVEDSQLLLGAKLSTGKDLNWWKGVATGIINPMDMESLAVALLSNPDEATQALDSSSKDTFTQWLYSAIDGVYINQTPSMMAKDLASTIFSGLVSGNISKPLLSIYQKWIGSVSAQESVKAQILQYEIPTDINVLAVNPTHPFAEIDRMLLRQLSQALSDGRDINPWLNAIAQRIESDPSKEYRAEWLEAAITLFTFKHQNLYDCESLSHIGDYYHDVFAKVDNAIRHIYTAWLNEPSVLKPIQRLYEQFETELLSQWFKVMKLGYFPEQQNIIPDTLSKKGKIAIIVGDGLRLELAQEVSQHLKEYTGKRKWRISNLPSITECGMSALYGCETVEKTVKKRIEALKQFVPDVQVKPLDKLNDEESAQKLVLTYGDIDQVGEKKQLAGLKDISNYPVELAQAIDRLIKMGYDEVWLTADHGFVITGLIDDSDKIYPPSKPGLKVEERYLHSENDYVFPSYFQIIGPGIDYCYFAPSDKPFVTKGSYGYAHGGFTPQECIIPLYCFTTQENICKFSISILNKEELESVTGKFFTVKLKSAHEKRTSAKIILIDKEGKTLLSKIVKLNPDGPIAIELELTSSPLKCVITNQLSPEVLDVCEIKQSDARDIDDLFS